MPRYFMLRLRPLSIARAATSDRCHRPPSPVTAKLTAEQRAGAGYPHMNSLQPIAILSDISANRLECTAHCHEYGCMLRLGSRPNEDTVVSTPDIFSLCAIPILTDQDAVEAGRIAGESVVIPLLPSNQDDCTGEYRLDHHPCGDLLRSVHHLEKQLHERLKDASCGALNNKSNEDGQLGIYEEFLQRSEAIIKELLGAVHQYLRKEQDTKRARAISNRKRTASFQSSANILSPPPLNYYAELLQQLKTIDDLPHVTEIKLHKNADASKSSDNDDTSDVTKISVTCEDKKQRSHTWHAELYPTIVLTVDLPEDFTLIDNNLRLEKWWDDDQSVPVLPEIQRRIKQGIDTYQPLFDELDQLDSNLWILEPSLPARRSSVERRIALWEGGASMVIVLDPDKPRAAPVLVRFVGLTAAAMKAAKNTKNGTGDSLIDENTSETVDWSATFAEFVDESDVTDATAKRWSETRSVQENLELWFGAPLPSPLSSVKSDYLVECGICYSHRLPVEDPIADDDIPIEEGALPDVKCSNASCNRHYHQACLFEWLHSLPTAKTSFDRIFGSCPYCCETVSVSTSKVHRK